MNELLFCGYSIRMNDENDKAKFKNKIYKSKLENIFLNSSLSVMIFRELAELLLVHPKFKMIAPPSD